MVHYPAGSSISRCVHCSYKGMDIGQQQYSGRLWCLNYTQLVLRGSKCAKKIPSAPFHHHHQPEPLRQGRMDPCFHVLYAKFWPYHLSIGAEIETHQTRQRFFQSSIIQFWWACANCSLSFLFLADRSGTWCGLLLLQPSIFVHTTAAHWIFSLFRTILCFLNTHTGAVWHQQPFHVQSHLNPLSSPILMLSLTFSKSSSPHLDA